MVTMTTTADYALLAMAGYPRESERSDRVPKGPIAE